MIGVIARPEEMGIVEEFFQLFKTPWEPFHEGRPYGAVLASVEQLPALEAPLVIVCGTRPSSLDSVHQVSLAQSRSARLSIGGETIPIYGELRSVNSTGARALANDEDGAMVAVLQQKGEQTVIRVGYDFFHEIAFLLNVGQPLDSAATPTLDRHI